MARVGRGSEDTSRQLLDTVAAVAADPKGYKARLSQLDAAQAKSLEAETNARVAQRDAQGALDQVRSERQALETQRRQVAEERAAALDEIRKARLKHDAIVETERATLKREAEVLAQRQTAVNDLQRDLTGKIEIHTRATESLVAEQRKAEALNIDLQKALDAANAREAAAAGAIARMRAALGSGK